MYRNPANQTGFTLIELLVVISIIGFLSSIVLASLNTAREKARIAKAESEVRTIYQAMLSYRADNGNYDNLVVTGVMLPCWAGLSNGVWTPNSGGGNNICTTEQWNAGWLTPYMATVPLDPWDHPYMFDGRSDTSECSAYASSLCSAGPNGALDGVNNQYNTASGFGTVQISGDDICIYPIPEC